MITMHLPQVCKQCILKVPLVSACGWLVLKLHHSASWYLKSVPKNVSTKCMQNPFSHIIFATRLNTNQTAAVHQWQCSGHQTQTRARSVCTLPQSQSKNLSFLCHSTNSENQNTELWKINMKYNTFNIETKLVCYFWMKTVDSKPYYL